MLGLAVLLSCSAPPAATDPDPISILLIVIWVANVFLTVISAVVLILVVIPFSPVIVGVVGSVKNVKT